LSLREESVLRGKFLGSILGGAIGDALGALVEGMDYIYIKALYGKISEFIEDKESGRAPGEWTDETEQLLLMASSIILAGEFNLDVYIEHLMKFGNALFSGRIKNKGISASTISALKRLIEGVPYTDSGDVKPALDPAVRAIPIGLMYNDNFVKAAEMAAKSSIPTHKHPHSISGACAVAAAIAEACNPKTSMQNIAKKAIYGASLIKKGIAKRIEEAVQKSISTDIPLRMLLPISLDDVSASISLAFAIIMRAKNFEDGLIKAVNIGGDSDGVGCITGSILGTYYTINAIPERWINKIEQKKMLEIVGSALYHLYAFKHGIKPTTRTREEKKLSNIKERLTKLRKYLDERIKS